MTVVDPGSRTRKRLVSLVPWTVSLVATVVAAACGGPSGTTSTSTGAGGSGGSSGGPSSTATTSVSAAATSSSGEGGGGGGASTMVGGLPCGVLDALQTRCVSCHGSPLKYKAPMPLLNYANLTTPSDVDPTLTFAERCVIRMQKAASPMPPGAAVSMTAAQIGAFTTWIEAGYPQGECDPSDAGPIDDDAGDAAGEGP
jgi:hypothetical protein